MSSPLTRRQAVAALLAPALIGLTRKSPPRIAGGFVDDGGATGHRLRDGAAMPAVRRTVRTGVVIVGAGIAGLSAAWWLRRRGMDDFVVLELERQAGGNSRWGENDATRFPWAAHYVPLPGPEATLVRTLFEELGVWRDGAWDERHLVFAPRERLLVHGEWQPDVEPHFALPAWEREEMRRFHERMAELRATGAFTVPSRAAPGAALARSAPLDRESMAAWLDRERFRSPALRWYVDYACRDDYGALARDTSAWAGVHYFASRTDDDAEGPLTWPEGNGFVVRKLLERTGPRVITGAPVHRVERAPGGKVRVLRGDVAYLADQVVLAAPGFVAARLVESGVPLAPARAYSPWLTANLVLRRPPRERRGAEPSWDNVIYDSPSLGYVVANHQSLRTHEPRPVWTFYHALSDGTPSAGRQLLLGRSWRDWVEWILADLARAHPDIRDCVERVDVLRMGHAMVRPTVGFLGDLAREAAPSALLGGRVH
ncbi:MAG TPA: FAD-dependent oxidoreductase, partial [Gemmatimonadaceae bacterium]|nr:FAD-dependent oxidoreductase [Gemmatimonadaceae bacterium]